MLFSSGDIIWAKPVIAFAITIGKFDEVQEVSAIVMWVYPNLTYYYYRVFLNVPLYYIKCVYKLIA